MNQALINTCADVLQIDPGELGPDSNADNIAEWDSLKHWEIIAALETLYGIEFSMDEAAAFKNLGDIEACLTLKGVI